MTCYHEIIQEFPVDELIANEQERQAIRACVDLMLSTSEDFATATSLSILLLANKAGRFAPSEAFLAAHPDNHPEAYSGPATYLAFYLLFLCEKARSAMDILDEQERCSHYTSSSAGDADTCGRCEDHAAISVPIALMGYDSIPPYHLGCRCRPLLLHA
jgi:hypothetical protein